MDISLISSTGLFLRFPEGGVAVNPGESKRADAAKLILNTLPIPVSGWPGVFSPRAEGQHVFSGAGEFECNGLQVRGYGCAATVDGTDLQTTSWVIHGDGMRVLVLGAVTDAVALQHALAEVDAVDVLVVFCPASGAHLSAGDLSGLVAAKQVSTVVLTGDDTGMLEKTGKELGNLTKSAGKHSIKKKDIAGEGVQAVLLE